VLKSGSLIYVKGSAVAKCTPLSSETERMIHPLFPESDTEEAKRALFQLNSDNQNHYVVIVSGDHIIPAFPLIKSKLAHEQESYLTLIYLNDKEGVVLYQDELSSIQNTSNSRLMIHFLSFEKSIEWGLNNNSLHQEILGVVIHTNYQSDLYFLIGGRPELNAQVADWFRFLEVDPRRILAYPSDWSGLNSRVNL